jgi:hypothetical protein
VNVADQEDDYFAKLDREKTAQLKAAMDAKEAAKKVQELKDLHWNRCGRCGSEMDAVPFRGVEIEVCPQCGAVLLDHGELEVLAGEDSSGILKNLFSMFQGPNE